MRGLAIILLFNLLGLLAQRALALPLPANVLGMIFLLLALASGLVKLAWVEATANYLLKHMVLFFLPFIVASVALWPLIRQNWLALVGGMVVSTLLTLAVTGLLVRWLSGGESAAPAAAPKERV
jgi:holin-like protein